MHIVVFPAPEAVSYTHLFGYDETAVMDVKGIKVGLVGIYELYDHLEREQQLKDNIAKAKADGAQLIVVIYHWGNETETVPDSNQTTLGRIAICLLYTSNIRRYHPVSWIHRED